MTLVRCLAVWNTLHTTDKCVEACNLPILLGQASCVKFLESVKILTAEFFVGVRENKGDMRRE